MGSTLLVVAYVGLHATPAHAAGITVTGSTITPTEGATFSGLVGSFTDTVAPDPAANFIVGVDWGDGTPTDFSTGPNVTIAQVGATANYTVGGTHRYAEQGTFTTTITVADADTSTGGGTGTANVADAALFVNSGAPFNFTAVEGTTNTFLVGQLGDADPNGTASDYFVCINWGDATPLDCGTAVLGAAGPPGVFNIFDAHVFPEQGSFTVTVAATEVDGSAPHSSAVPATTTATVTDAPLSDLGGATPLFAENVAGTQVVARFHDADTQAAAADFVATVVWGDGSPNSVGTVSALGTPGDFSVSAGHTYALEEGTAVSLATLVQDVDGGSSLVTGPTPVTIGDAALTAGPPTTNAGGTEGSNSGPMIVATFTDANLAAPVTDFTATVTWGDTTSSTGVVSRTGPGAFSVTANHTYATGGAKSISTSVRDAGGSTTSVAGTVNVGHTAITGGAKTVSGTEGASTGSVVVASFNDSNALARPGNFTAAINWGDGTTTAGTVSSAGGTSYNVNGTHTYAEEGGYAITVTVNDVDGDSVIVHSTGSIADANLTPTPVTFTPTEGRAFTGAVATFTDANVGAAASEFTASIAWGDGTTTSGTVTGGGGSFSVSGTHTYVDEGSHAVTVTVTDTGGSVTTANSTATVGDATLSSTAGGAITAVEGASTGNQVVATFTDANPVCPIGDFTASINWGDGGAVSAGTVANTGTCQFSVTAAHVYATWGSYAGTVTITDAGGATATSTLGATVSDPALQVTLSSFSPQAGAAYTGPVAGFTDPGGSEAAANYVASIDWGDGTTSPGTISGPTAGSFAVGGSHTYSAAGTFTVQVSVRETDQAASTAAAASAAIVVTAAATPFSAGPGHDFPTPMVAGLLAGLLLLITSVVGWRRRG